MRILGRRLCSISKINSLWSTNVKLLIDDEIDKTNNKNIGNEITIKELKREVQHIKKKKEKNIINKLEDPIRDIY